MKSLTTGIFPVPAVIIPALWRSHLKRLNRLKQLTYTWIKKAMSFTMPSPAIPLSKKVRWSVFLKCPETLQKKSKFKKTWCNRKNSCPSAGCPRASPMKSIIPWPRLWRLPCCCRKILIRKIQYTVNSKPSPKKPSDAAISSKACLILPGRTVCGGLCAD